MDNKLERMYNKWVYGAKSAVVVIPTRNGNIEAPLLTELLHRVCRNDAERFENLCAALERAYYAGLNDGVHASFTAAELKELEGKPR